MAQDIRGSPPTVAGQAWWSYLAPVTGVRSGTVSVVRWRSRDQSSGSRCQISASVASLKEPVTSQHLLKFLPQTVLPAEKQERKTPARKKMADSSRNTISFYKELLL